MALINDIIKKYEAEARQKIDEARKINNKNAESREDIFLKISNPNPQPVGDMSPNGSIWKVKPIKLEPRPQTEVQTQQEVQIQEPQISNEELQSEIEKLKKENVELRKRISELEIESV